MMTTSFIRRFRRPITDRCIDDETDGDMDEDNRHTFNIDVTCPIQYEEEENVPSYTGSQDAFVAF